MPVFRYSGFDLGGRSKAGDIEAISWDRALASLQGQGITPVTLQSASELPTAGWRRLKSWRVLLQGAIRLPIVTLTQQLASLLRAGLTVERALKVGVELSSSEPTRQFYSEVLRQVQQGHSLSEAMHVRRDAFPQYYFGMLSAGEASGALAEALRRLSEVLERDQRMRERVVTSLVYPFILLATITVTLLVIVNYVLPQFEAMFMDSRAPIPLQTQLVLEFGRFTRSYGLLLLLTMSVVSLIFRAMIRRPSIRLRIDRWALKRRLYSQTYGKAEAARFSRTLSMLLAGGVPLPSAIRTARRSLVNIARISAIDRLIDRVAAGRDFAGELKAEGVFPEAMLQLVRVGLETGRLPGCLEEVSTLMDDEATRTTDRIFAVAIPIMTLLMGALVAGIVGSVLVGILSINDLAG